jgi:hypothetical protein
MKHIIAMLLCTFGMNAALASPKPTERLMIRLLENHFERYICVDEFPEMRAQIQQAYDQSWFRYFDVPCHGLSCTDQKYERVLRGLFKNARGGTRAERRETCETYRARFEEIEKEFNPKQFGLTFVHNVPKANP